MNQSGNLHHIEFYVNNLEKSQKFWGTILKEYGWTTFQEWDEGISWKKDGGAYIVLVKVKSEFRHLENNRQAQGFNHLALFSDPNEDLDVRKEKIQKAGGKILKSLTGYLCFEGPDGLVGELYSQ